MVCMEKQTTMFGTSDNALLAAGASDLFVSYYNTAPERASARHEIDSGPFSLYELAEKPRLGGGFFEALWKGEEQKAFNRADAWNREILNSMSNHDVERVGVQDL